MMMTVTVISSKLFPIPIPVPIPIPIQMNLVFTIPSPFQTSKISSCCFHPKPGRRSTTVGSRMSGVPARDRVIDLGKYSGKMLGSLPSSYLRWVSKNLRAGDTEEWAKLADQVLTDPVYRDRIEWELADKILSGNETLSSADGRNAVSELLEISKRFGWDNEDKRGWSKVDFGLLGTSKGGRIPRVGAIEETGGIMKKKKKKIKAEEEEDGGKRRERRERVRRRMEGNKEMKDDEQGQEGGGVVSGAGGYGRMRSSPFPGREALMNKVLLNRQNIV
ncbi:hypothetical protein ABFS83_09G128500 [Erythranthe nasuta]